MVGPAPPPVPGPAAGKSLTFGCVDSKIVVASASTPDTGARNARSNARRRTASARQLGDPAYNQAPRPGAERPATSRPPTPRVIRTSFDWAALRRHPTHVRPGPRHGSAVAAGLLQVSGLGDRAISVSAGHRLEIRRRRHAGLGGLAGLGAARPLTGGDHLALGRVPFELAGGLVAHPLALGVFDLLLLLLLGREDAGLLVGQLALALDVDAPPGQAGSQAGVLALLPDGQRQLVVGDDDLGDAGVLVDPDLLDLRRRQGLGHEVGGVVGEGDD